MGGYDENRDLLMKLAPIRHKSIHFSSV